MATTPAAHSSTPEKFSDEERSLLTDEERAHLDDDLGDNVEDDPEAIAAANAAAKELEDGRAADKKAEEDAAAAQKAADDKAKADADAAKKAEDLAAQQKLAAAGDEAALKAIADQKALDDAATLKASQDAAAAAAAAAPKPAQRARDGVIERAPVMVEADIDAIDKKLLEVATKFDEGELTAVEMRTQEAELRKQQRELDKELNIVSVSSKTWGEQTVPDWLDAHPEYRADPELFKALDKEVRDQQAATRRQYDPTFLEEAHKKLATQVDAVKAKMTAAEEATVRRVLGLGPTDPLPKKTATVDPAVKDPKTRKLPPNLGGIPQSDIVDVSDGGKYAQLDRLADKDPIAYETAMARMTEAERNAYLNV